MRIAFITAGAAGMYCGSCMRDNTLVAALCAAGHDAVLIPTFTPITTDEPDVSTGPLFLGGINVYLQDKSWLFRHTPRFLDRLFDLPGLLKAVSGRASHTKYEDLGGMTLSMLDGTRGRQRKEFSRLAESVAREHPPEIVLLTNVLLSGLAPALKARLKVPVLATLQGDDVFLDALRSDDRAAAIDRIRANAAHLDGFIATSRDYADAMASYFGIDRAKIHVVPPGIRLKGFDDPAPPAARTRPAVGYFARISPEKGFHLAVDAFIRMRTGGGPDATFRASGWLGGNHRGYFDEQRAKLDAAGLGADFEYVESPDFPSKKAFLNSIDLFCVPATFREPKGLYVLEAWAAGLPVVLPERGAFPELVARTGGGLLVKPDDPAALADAFAELLADPARRADLAGRGRRGVEQHYTAARMADTTMEVLRTFLPAA